LFTGIVTGIGKIERVAPAAGGSRRLTISTALDLARLALGASIAVSGVCLTVVRRRARGFEADLGPETLARTTLGNLTVGDRVHLERPLRMGDELGGHLVSGHVDGVGRIAGRRPEGDALTLRIAAPAAVSPFLARKGSVAVDGVSLTINEVADRVFSVTLIPHTLAVTCLGERQRADRVNIEADLIAKHVARLAERQLS
jgi:riboflavin synthase